jgi:pimeloyl-ACP methyl ester carboxylesterase
MTDPMSDVVVLIPGITGSVLQRDGKDVWALSAGAALRGALSLGKSIKHLELHGDDPDLDDLGDGIVATRLMPDLHVLPGLGWKIDGYAHVKDSLFKRFDLRAGHNYFELPYDWRRDNRVAARKLARNTHDWLKQWREESGNQGAKLIIIGHSMGGIIARLYLEMLDGWRDTRSLITFGTPYSGSLNALDFLANGFHKGWGPFSIDFSSMLRSFTSVYQLLPSYRCLEGDGGAWNPLDEVDWHGTGVDDARLRAAIGLQRELRKAVDDRLATGVPGYDVRPVVGDFQRTGWAARRVDGKVAIASLRALHEEGGDGTVPKVSAMPHELLEGLTNATFVSQKHASLQNDEPVLTHVAGLLRSKAIGEVPVFPAADESIALEVDDVTTAEPLVIRARPAQAGTQLSAHVRPLDGGAVQQVKLKAAADGWQEAVIEGLAATDYRVSVTSIGSHTVTDVASVVDLDSLEEAAGG